MTQENETEEVQTNLTYEQLGMLVDALRTQLDEYERRATKYMFTKEGDPHYVPNYYTEIYKPTRKKMSDERDHYLSLRQQIRDKRKAEKKKK